LTEQMPTCGDALAWPAPAPAADAVAFHTCPMHPAVRQPDPGSCPLCGMDLVPVRAAELQTGTVTVDPARRRQMGLRTTTLAPQPLIEELRLLGLVTWDDEGRSALTARVDGVVARAHVHGVGAVVQPGQVVLELSSPELSAAQDELLLLARGGAADGGPARQRLLRFGVAAQDIDAVLRAGAPRPSLPLRAGPGGVVVSKDFVRGAPVDEGMVLLELGRTDPAWVEVQVFEGDLPAVQPGAAVELRPRGGGRLWTGAVGLLSPALDPESRSAAARVVVPNPDGALRPGGHLEATLRVDHGVGLVAPSEAVLVLGQTRLVFVDLGEGRLQPRPVEVGRRVQGGLQLVSGVQAGEQIVVSGTFLIASESRLRTAAALWDAPAEVSPAAP
jgi:Cu(I)/Ag(I) efflux system membrane fusion protein